MENSYKEMDFEELETIGEWWSPEWSLEPVALEQEPVAEQPCPVDITPVQPAPEPMVEPPCPVEIAAAQAAIALVQQVPPETVQQSAPETAQPSAPEKRTLLQQEYAANRQEIKELADSYRLTLEERRGGLIIQDVLLRWVLVDNPAADGDKYLLFHENHGEKRLLFVAIPGFRELKSFHRQAIRAVNIMDVLKYIGRHQEYAYKKYPDLSRDELERLNLDGNKNTAHNKSRKRRAKEKKKIKGIERLYAANNVLKLFDELSSQRITG